MPIDKIIIGNDSSQGGKWVNYPFIGPVYVGDLVGSDSLNEMILGRGGNDTIWGWAGDDELYGEAGNDYIVGNDGHDKLWGGDGDDYMSGDDDLGDGAIGNDHMWGGRGNDRMFGDAGNDYLYGEADHDQLFGEEGNDVLDGGSGNDIVDGGAGNDELYGRDGDDRLLGGAGNDRMWGGSGANRFDGGAGDDTYYLQSAADIITGDSSGYDVVYANYSVDLSTGGAGIEKLVLQSSVGATLIGNSLDNVIVGGSGNDTLGGGHGKDDLDGGAGADIMRGGTGADTYTVDNAGDVVDETGGDVATDLIRLLGNTALNLSNTAQVRGDVENVVYSGSGAFGVSITGNGLSNVLDATKSWSSTLSGGDGNDTLYGGIGSDVLIGGNGNDRMVGGAGNDNYEVNSAQDVVIELQGGGTADTIRSWTNWTLGDNIENGEVLDHTYGRTLTGNALANRLTGNNGDDRLYGREGNDALYGGNGNDLLDGGTGNDVMEGYTGNDIYYVDSASDTVIELAGAGTDEVRTSLSTYTLGQNVENLEYIHANDFTGVGNALANRISGDDGADRLFGMDGKDTLYGYNGNDRLYGGKGSDTLNGGAGGDFLDGGEGFDTVSYAGASGGVSVNLATQSAGGAGALNDTIVSIEGVIGSDFDDIVYGGNWAESFSGGKGNDLLYGSLGADKFAGGQGRDAVSYANSNAAVKVDLSAGTATGGFAEGDKLTSVETVAGSAFADKLTGNASDNILSGGAGADRLFGRGGNDTLTGGADADVFIFKGVNGQDRIQDFTDGVDMLQFHKVTFDDLSFSQSQLGTTISIAGTSDSVFLLNVKSSQLTEADFIFVG